MSIRGNRCSLHALWQSQTAELPFGLGAPLSHMKRPSIKKLYNNEEKQ